MEAATVQSQGVDNRRGDKLTVDFPMRHGALLLAIVGAAGASAGGNGWWVAGGAWLVAIVLLAVQPARGAQIASQLRRDVGEAGAVKRLQTFTLYWERRGGGGGTCDFSSLTTAAQAAERLMQTGEAEGHIKCYDLIWLPRVGEIPTRWLRWDADEGNWINKWSTPGPDIGVLARERELRAQTAAMNWLTN